MKLQQTTRVFSLIALGTSILLGCNTQPQSAARPLELTTIAEGIEPTEEAKQALLAAKEDLFKQLSGRLMAAMNTGGPAEAVEVCYAQAPKIAKEVGETHNIRIGRTGVRLRNTNNEAPGWAKELVESQIDTPTFAVLSNDKAVALLPIKLQPQCLMCHGPVEQISDEVKRVLANRYPNDQATGFRDGDLRGWFWVEEI